MFHVAICEQMESPEEAKKRGIPQTLVQNLWKSMIKSFIVYEEEIFDDVSKKSIK